MRKHKMFKRTLSLLLCMIMVFGSGLAGVGLTDVTASAAGKKITDYSVGDIVEFGWYPQSEVTDTNLIAALNKAAGVDTANVAKSTSVANGWISYNYYSGTGNYDDGQMVASDYMRYTDVVYNGNKYRGVVFDSYRPYATGYASSANNSYQDNNGYNTSTVYWFKYEPIKWRVLDPSTGMVMCEMILDSQAYNNYIIHFSSSSEAFFGNSALSYLANNYAKSNIREWLNKDFYNTAFSVSQKDTIAATTLDNSAYITDYSKYDSATTYDKIYLLSYSDVLNTSYSFSSSTGESTNRTVQGSDYAKSQGLGVSTSSSYSGNSDWLLRSAGDRAFIACMVGCGGHVDASNNTSGTGGGVRPAFNFNTTSEIIQCEVTDLDNSNTNNKYLPDLLEWLESLSDKLRNFFNAIIEWLKSLFNQA